MRNLESVLAFFFVCREVVNIGASIDDWLSRLLWCILHDWLTSLSRVGDWDWLSLVDLWLGLVDLLIREWLVDLGLLRISHLISSVIVVWTVHLLVPLIVRIGKFSVELAYVSKVEGPRNAAKQTDGPGVDNREDYCIACL